MKDKYLRFTNLITDIIRNIRRLTSEATVAYNLKRSYVPCLYFLYKQGPLSATKLTKLCAEDKANVSRTLRALEDDGLIVKEIRSSGRTRLMLTESGMEIGKYLVDRVNEAVSRATLGLTDGEVESMYKSLEAINLNLSCALLSAD